MLERQAAAAQHGLLQRCSNQAHLQTLLVPWKRCWNVHKIPMKFGRGACWPTKYANGTGIPVIFRSNVVGGIFTTLLGHR